MRERINQLAKGIVDIESSVIVWEPLTIEETLSAGEIRQGQFLVSSRNELPVRGLAYSSNVRVKVKNDAFGGLHNYISYEVNSSYLEHDDHIKGSFYLVTNGGEQEIPYSFRITSEKSGQTLQQFKTAADFAELTRKDLDTALRLFECAEFTGAPFLQDLHAKTLYQGIKGHGNRYHQLEQLLVALEAKPPVHIKISETKKVYEYPAGNLEDVIALEKSSWGYFSVQVKLDGDFIQMSRKAAGELDFHSEVCQLPYTINPAKLHRGNNLGSITLITCGESIKIEIEVSGHTDPLELQEENRFYKRDFEKYLQLRLAYENQILDKNQQINQMLIQIERARMCDQSNALMALFQAELHLLKGQVDKAIPILEEYRADILARRQENKEIYCFYQYLILLAVPDARQQESFLRLIYKYWEMKQIKGVVLLLLLKLDPDLYDNPEYCLVQLKKIFKGGCTSPFLFSEACRIWNHNPELLQSLEEFEIQALHCASKRGLISRELGVMICRVLSTSKRHQKLFLKIMMNLYEQYSDKEVLTGICSLLIRENRDSSFAFVWYERALAEDISLTRLYEYFLYALPDHYQQLMPKEVLLYFSYDHNLDVQSKSVLYHNILMYMERIDPLYPQYEREIGKFATEQLLSVRMNQRLALIYDRMIYRDMIDLPMAKVLPSMLKANCVTCQNILMKYVVVRYEELIDEEIYPLVAGEAYIPLFSAKCVILFQDIAGNRYSHIDYHKKRILVKPELERRCFELFPNHPMLLLQACKAIAEKALPDEADIMVLERGLTELPINPYYGQLLQRCMIEFYQRQMDETIDHNSAALSLAEPAQEKNSDHYLLRIDPGTLSRRERNMICEYLISNHYVKEPYELILEYGWEGISTIQLAQLADKMILQQLFDQDERLMKLAQFLFFAGEVDRVVLDYLCEYFNGSSKQMYQLLRQSLTDHVETYDLEERLLAQMLFSDYQDTIDQVFDWYVAKKKISEKIVKAFFTMKSAEYVLDQGIAKERVFTYLESTVQSMMKKTKMPTIFLLALSKYYASLAVLTEPQKRLCETIMKILLQQGIIMSFMKALEKHILMPDEIMDKGIIEYHGKKNSTIDLQIRVLPQEEEYHSVSMRRMYQGIFVKQMVLFEGEIIEYQIYELQDEQPVLAEEGSVACDLHHTGQKEGRFADLNRMGLYDTVKEDTKLKHAMKEYMIRDTAVKELFKLL